MVPTYMKLPEQLQFNGSVESIGFNPVTPASSTKLTIENSERQLRDLDTALNLEKSNLDGVARVKANQAGRDMLALADFSKTLGKYVTDLAEKTQQDIEIGQQWDWFMQGFGESSVTTPQTPEQQRLAAAENAAVNAANVQGDQAARFANEVETSTGSPVLGNMAWQQTGELARGIRGEEAILMGARSSYNGWLAAFLQSGATIRVNGQQIGVAEAVSSGDPALTNAAITQARFEFIRQQGLHLTTKANFVKHLMPTMLATEGAVSGSLVAGAIKGQREERQQEIQGRGYDLAQTIQPSQVGETFETLSRQFLQGGLGISRAQANRLAVETMISAFEDKGNVDGLQALLDVQQKPGQVGTELRRLYGNEINDALERAHGRRDTLDDRAVKDIEAGMYQELAGAQTQQQRDAIIERTAQQLEGAGLYRQARALRQERDELSVAGANELNTARLEEGLRNGSVTADQVEQARLRGDITPQQAEQVLRNAGQDNGSKEAKEDLKNPLFKGVTDGWGDRFETEFLAAVGLSRDVYGRVLPNSRALISNGQAEIIRQQARNDIRILAETTLRQNAGRNEAEKQAALHQVLKEWYKDEFKTKGGKYFVAPATKDSRGVPTWDADNQRYLTSLSTSPQTLGALDAPRALQRRDFASSGLVTGTTLTPKAVQQFRRIRNDKLFSLDTLESLRHSYEKDGVFQQGLQRAAQQLGMSPLALLQQQSAAHGLDPIRFSPVLLQSSSGGQAPMAGVRGSQILMGMGFPARGAAWLAGNIQQESNWNGQRQPWNDNGALSGGLVSWRAGRLQNAENALGDITGASNEAQLRYMVQEMRTKYPNAYRVFMDSRSTDRQLREASKQYWGYGEEGNRYGYAQQIEATLRGRPSQAGSNPGRPNRYGTPQQRAVAIGRMIVDQGGGVWQNEAFDIDRGFVGRGGRVGQHSPNSHHYSNAALDIPLQRNTEGNLRRIFNYLRQNQQRLGIVELFWNPMGFYRNGGAIGGAGSNAIPNHDNHIHVAFG